MNEHIDKIESLLQRFDYHELNVSDKKFADEVIGSEEAYILLRKSTLQARDSGKSLSANKRMKGQLVDQFKEAHSSGSSSPVFAVFGKRMPIYYSLILMLLTALPFIYLLSQKPQSPDPQITYVNVPGPTDTLFITKPADTIFTERVVYQKVFVPAESKKETVVAQKTLQKPAESFTASDVNTSLADNKALNDLMISIE